MYAFSIHLCNALTSIWCDPELNDGLFVPIGCVSEQEGSKFRFRDAGLHALWCISLGFMDKFGLWVFFFNYELHILLCHGVSGSFCMHLNGLFKSPGVFQPAGFAISNSHTKIAES